MKTFDYDAHSGKCHLHQRLDQPNLPPETAQAILYMATSTSNWDDVVPILVGLHKHFERHPFHSQIVGGIYNPESLTEFFFDRDKEENAQITKAVSQYARIGQFPELTWQQALLLYVRIKHAMLLLQVLNHEIDDHVVTCPNGDIGTGGRLYWLLETSWQKYRELHYPYAARKMLGK
ncbi:MAG TPA: hypothetical protein VGI03_04775 [Verrucomicrobiae bacterium]